MPPTNQPHQQLEQNSWAFYLWLNRSRLCPIRVLYISLVFDRALLMQKRILRCSPILSTLSLVLMFVLTSLVKYDISFSHQKGYAYAKKGLIRSRITYAIAIIISDDLISILQMRPVNFR